MFRSALLIGMCLVLVIPHKATAQISAVACDNYANSYAHQASRHGQLIGGTAVGSLVGLGIGALFAASGVGAAIGATVGLVGGGALRHQREQEIYNAAYQDCLAGRRP